MRALSEIQQTIKILDELLNQKLGILSQILNISENQKMFVSSLEDETTLNSYLCISLKEKQSIIDELKIIDDKFIKIFEGFGGELNQNKDFFKNEIQNIQTKIQSITDLDIKIRAQEENNKLLFQNISKNKLNTLKASKNYILNKYAENTKKS